MANIETLLADTRYFVDQGSDPAAPSAGNRVLYTKSGGLYLRSSAAILGPILDEPAHDALDHTGLTGVGGASVVQYAVMTADDPVSATALSNVAGMSFALAASSKYLVEYFLHLDTNATSVGIKLALNSGDAGTTIWLGQFNPTTAPALNTQYAGGITYTKDVQPFVTTTGPGGTRSFAMLTAVVVTTTNPDTLQLRHGSETATLTTIYANSAGRCSKIA